MLTEGILRTLAAPWLASTYFHTISRGYHYIRAIGEGDEKITIGGTPPAVGEPDIQARIESLMSRAPKSARILGVGAFQATLDMSSDVYQTLRSEPTVFLVDVLPEKIQQEVVRDERIRQMQGVHLDVNVEDLYWPMEELQSRYLNKTVSFLSPSQQFEEV